MADTNNRKPEEHATLMALYDRLAALAAQTTVDSFDTPQLDTVCTEIATLRRPLFTDPTTPWLDEAHSTVHRAIADYLRFIEQHNRRCGPNLNFGRTMTETHAICPVCGAGYPVQPGFRTVLSVWMKTSLLPVGGRLQLVLDQLGRRFIH